MNLGHQWRLYLKVNGLDLSHKNDWSVLLQHFTSSFVWKSDVFFPILAFAFIVCSFSIDNFTASSKKG